MSGMILGLEHTIVRKAKSFPLGFLQSDEREGENTVAQ